MSDTISLDAAVRMKGEMHGFMRGELQDHEGESQLENHLQGHETQQRVVVALLDWSEETVDWYRSTASCMSEATASVEAKQFSGSIPN